MGKKIICMECSSIFDEDVLKAKNNTELCPVCGAGLDGNGPGHSAAANSDPQKDWITWYYFKSRNYDSYSLWDKLPKYPENFILVKDFKAPPRDANGKSDRAKEILRTYVPDAFPVEEVPVISCPICGSREYTMMNRGFSLFTGFLGSGSVKRVCNRCKTEF